MFKPGDRVKNIQNGKYGTVMQVFEVPQLTIRYDGELEGEKTYSLTSFIKEAKTKILFPEEVLLTQEKAKIGLWVFSLRYMTWGVITHINTFVHYPLTVVIPDNPTLQYSFHGYYITDTYPSLLLKEPRFVFDLEEKKTTSLFKDSDSTEEVLNKVRGKKIKMVDRENINFSAIWKDKYFIPDGIDYSRKYLQFIGIDSNGERTQHKIYLNMYWWVEVPQDEVERIDKLAMERNRERRMKMFIDTFKGKKIHAVDKNTRVSYDDAFGQYIIPTGEFSVDRKFFTALSNSGTISTLYVIPDENLYWQWELYPEEEKKISIEEFKKKFMYKRCVLKKDQGSGPEFIFIPIGLENERTVKCQCKLELNGDVVLKEMEIPKIDEWHVMKETRTISLIDILQKRPCGDVPIKWFIDNITSKGDTFNKILLKLIEGNHNSWWVWFIKNFMWGV